MPLARLNLPRSCTAVPVPRARPGGLSLRSIDFNPPVKSIVLRIILLGAAESGIFPYKLACLVFDSSLDFFTPLTVKPKTHACYHVRACVRRCRNCCLIWCLRSEPINFIMFFSGTQEHAADERGRVSANVSAVPAPQNEQQMSFEGACGE